MTYTLHHRQVEILDSDRFGMIITAEYTDTGAELDDDELSELQDKYEDRPWHGHESPIEWGVKTWEYT